MPGLPPRPASKVNLLPAGLGSLARDLPPAEPETLFVLGTNGGLSVAPDIEFPVLFGRNEPDVHVCVGADDPHVSRKHGIITRQYSHWVLNNTGRLPIRLPGAHLVLRGDQAELPAGYTPVFIVGPHQEHLLQVRIAAHTPSPGYAARHEAKTRDRKVWPLKPAQKLVLVCLGQRYLQSEPQPQPLSWREVAAELSYLRPNEHWTWRKAAHKVREVRLQLSRDVPDLPLREEDVLPPVGNALNHNLIMELLVSTTITKADLRLLDGPSQ